MSRSSLQRAAFVLSFFLGWSGLPGNAKPAISRDAAPLASDATSEVCQITKNDGARMRCYGVNVAQTQTQEGGTGGDMWRLVRAPNPTGGREAVSITRAADVSRSDLEFAGLMLRCGETSIDVLFVSVRAFSPRAHPKVKVVAGSSSAEFTANVAPPDVLLLLPREATALASFTTDAFVR